MKRRLKTSISCPFCRERIGLISGIKAPTPFTLRCPHCRTWLYIRMPGMFVFVVALIALIVLSVISIPMIAAAFGSGWMHLYVLALIGVWLLAELGTGMLFFTYGTFTPIRNRMRLRR